ncbi:hypothetical protein [Pseudomonas umsongensis]|uniref:hypothetical protein n=1 Tax=Pseudomonas umsongensis TaxID=198618 RepID=UPI0015C154A7|nr:hypothetical protein [Pseudomonas umsongensis]NWL19931.1 hypothetical protein [Pseudomonas umsongensis]
MRMTKNKAQVLEALAFIADWDNVFPPHTAATVQRILKENLEYGDFDPANLIRTLKALVNQGLVKSDVTSVDVSGDTGCINRWYQREMTQYWPADLDLEATIIKYKGTPEEQELKKHNCIGWMVGAPALTLDEFREYKVRKAAALG